MPAKSKNVNNTDVFSEKTALADMPLDLMGLFFFAYRDFVSDADALLATKDLGRAHHRVLYFVNIRPGMSVATLLSILKITKQSLARVLRQLIDNEYIEQQTGETDRRQRLLFATAKGQELFKTLSAMQTDRINSALATLPQESADIVRRFFVEMVEENDREVLARLKLTDRL